MLSVAARAQERRLETSLKDIGLTRTGWYVLLAIGAEGLAHPSDIAEFVRIDRTAGSRALRQLEESGLIARQTGKPDRRTTNVRLTAKGRRRLEAGVPMAMANTAAMDTLLDTEDRAQIRHLLGKLIDGIPAPLKSL